MVDAFSGTYIIMLNLDEWRGALDQTDFKVLAIPLFKETGGDGNPTGRRIDGGAWGEDIPKNIAPPMKAFFNDRQS